MNYNLEEIAENYDNLHVRWKRLELLVRENEFKHFLTHTNGKSSVLEIGLGDGAFTKHLADNFKNVVAVDGSLVTLNNVREMLKSYNNIYYICSYVENLKIDQKIDNIIMSHLLEHIEKPIETLKYLLNIINNKTVIYISVPNALSLHRQVAVKMGLLDRIDELNDTDIKLGHRRVYTPFLLKKHLKTAGFDSI
jgi:2-polyprenyl-3-methyl-5-hydroxy-6-metoxy-1,4-benzoquinol methylase